MKQINKDASVKTHRFTGNARDILASFSINWQS